jgi:hypothetical protein
MKFALIVLLALSATPAVAKHANAAPLEIKSTSWSYTYKGAKMLESIDANGNSISQTLAGKHVDHGTDVVKGHKICYTSAMTKEGEVCWTFRPIKVGETTTAVSDKGEKLRLTRIKYTPLSMPK